MRRKGHEHMIAIIDYDAGNIKSVEKAMHLLGQEVVVTRDRESVSYTHLTLPTNREV